MYLLTLSKAVFCLIIGFILSTIAGCILIPFLRKFKLNQTLNIYLRQSHSLKQGTPTMGGFIFIIPPLLAIIILTIIGKIKISYNFIVVIFTFICYSLIGFIDDFLIIKEGNNKGLSEKAKLILQIVVALIFFYLFMKAGNEPLLWIHSFGIKWHIGWFYGIFILFILVASSNAVNLTDGLDGLAGGLSFLAFMTFGILSLNAGWLNGYEEIAIFCFLLSGSLLGFLIFNSYPAKVFMGDTGSLSLGATLGAISIITRHELLLTIVGFVFVIETLSCIIQRIYFKFTKKRIFPMTPIHHSFEKKGFKEQDIIKIFWIAGFITSGISIIFGVCL